MKADGASAASLEKLLEDSKGRFGGESLHRQARQGRAIKGSLVGKDFGNIDMLMKNLKNPRSGRDAGVLGVDAGVRNEQSCGHWQGGNVGIPARREYSIGWGAGVRQAWCGSNAGAEHLG